MSNSITRDDPFVKVIVGVDTHKHEHVAVAINDLGARLATFRAPANGAGYADLVAWARTLGDLEAFGIEGTGSYGVGLASFVRRQGLRVVEVNRCDRRKRRNNGKSDTLDAESAARSVLAGVATGIPKTADGAAEMVRQIKIAHDTAIKARTAAMTTLKTLIVNAPSRVREALEPLTDQKLIDRCAALRPGDIIDPTGSVKHALRALAARWRSLSTEIGTTSCSTSSPGRQCRPCVRRSGLVPSPRPMMIVAGDNPAQVRSEAAFAKLCGACPIPASSGVTNRHRLFRGGHRQANAALYRIVIGPHALAPADPRLRPATHRRGLVEERHHPLPETLRRPGDLPRADRRPPIRRSVRIPLFSPTCLSSNGLYSHHPWS